MDIRYIRVTSDDFEWPWKVVPRGSFLGWRPNVCLFHLTNGDQIRYSSSYTGPDVYRASPVRPQGNGARLGLPTTIPFDKEQPNSVWEHNYRRGMF